MGIYDRLDKIGQGSPTRNAPVGSSNATKTVETAKDVPSSVSGVKNPATENQEAITDLGKSPPASEGKVETLGTPSTPAQKTESKKARMQERKIERLQESKKERFLSFLRAQFDVKAASTISFRYPEELMQQLEETQYRIKQEYRKKLTKNAILVTALAFLLWDFEQKAPESVLYKYLVTEQE